VSAMRKKYHEGVGERLIQHKAKLSACCIGFETHARVVIFKLHNALKHFWSSFWILLAIQKCYMITHMTNSDVFSVYGAVFSEECCMKKITLLFV